MKLLHIFRSDPDELADSLARAREVSRSYDEVFRVRLAADPVNYNRLVELIFECDEVQTWF